MCISSLTTLKGYLSSDTSELHTRIMEDFVISKNCRCSVSTSPHRVIALSSSTTSSSSKINKSSLEEVSNCCYCCEKMSKDMELSLVDDFWSLTDLSSALSEVEVCEKTSSNVPTDHWSRNSCDSLKGRISSLFLNDFMSDVCFVCESSFTKNTTPEQTKVILPAHKFILCSASSVFYTMFYGSLPESSQNVIISDIKSETFIEMLRYLYCDQIDALDDVNCLLGLLYASRKYLLNSLFEQTTKILMHMLSSQNACLVLESAIMFEITDLTHQALEFVDAQTDICLKSENILGISLQTLTLILQRQTLTASEVSLFPFNVKTVFFNVLFLLNIK